MSMIEHVINGLFEAVFICAAIYIVFGNAGNREKAKELESEINKLKEQK